MARFPTLMSEPSRQVAAAAAVIAAAVLLITALSLWQAYDRTVARAEAETRNVARLLAEHVGQTFDGINDTLRAVDRLRRDVDRGIYRSQASIHVNLRTLQGGSPVLAEVEWLDAYGERVGNSRTFAPPPANLAGTEVFALPAGQPGSSAPAIATPSPSGEAGRHWKLGVSRRMENLDGTLAGVAVGWLDLQAFTRLFESLELPPGYTMALIRSDGVMLAEAPSSGLVPGDAWPDPDLIQLRPTDGGSATYSPQGDSHFASFATVPRIAGRMLVNVQVLRTAALAQFRRDLAVAVLEAALGLAVLLLGARMIVSGLRRREELQAALAATADHARAARAEAESASRAKSDFLARMSHELRTPLNAVLGFGQMIELDPARTLSERQREYCGYILRSGAHLLDLINEVLDFAGVESGRLSLAHERLSVAEMIASVATLMHPVASKAQVTVTTTAGEDAGTVLGDGLRLRQVLINLVANAIKYNRAGGRVTVSAAASPRSGIRIAVGDTGPGIPPERQEGLFEPFERLGAEHTGVEGTGLGLALSKRLVEAMGGSIGFESSVGVGSIFWVDLPGAGPSGAAARHSRAA